MPLVKKNGRQSRTVLGSLYYIIWFSTMVCAKFYFSTFCCPYNSHIWSKSFCAAILYSSKKSFFFLRIFQQVIKKNYAQFLDINCLFEFVDSIYWKIFEPFFSINFIVFYCSLQFILDIHHCLILYIHNFWIPVERDSVFSLCLQYLVILILLMQIIILFHFPLSFFLH